MMMATVSELELVALVHRRLRHGALERGVLAVTSRHFTRDLSCCVFTLGLLCLLRAGYAFFWAVLVAHWLGALCRQAVPGERPARVDNRFQARLSVRGSGAVSPLVVFATLVAVEAGAALPRPYGVAAGCALVLLCGYSRVCAMAHFPHQVAFSVLVGAAAIVLSRAAALRTPKMSGNGKLLAALGGASLVLVELMWAIEQDRCEVRGLNVEKREYIRVMNNIMSGDVPQTSGDEQRRDSFVKLVQSMEKRAMGAEAAVATAVASRA